MPHGWRSCRTRWLLCKSGEVDQISMQPLLQIRTIESNNLDKSRASVADKWKLYSMESSLVSLNILADLGDGMHRLLQVRTEGSKLENFPPFSWTKRIRCARELLRGYIKNRRSLLEWNLQRVSTGGNCSFRVTRVGCFHLSSLRCILIRQVKDEE